MKTRTRRGEEEQERAVACAKRQARHAGCPTLSLRPPQTNHKLMRTQLYARDSYQNPDGTSFETFYIFIILTTPPPPPASLILALSLQSLLTPPSSLSRFLSIDAPTPKTNPFLNPPPFFLVCYSFSLSLLYFSSLSPYFPIVLWFFLPLSFLLPLFLPFLLLLHLPHRTLALDIFQNKMPRRSAKSKTQWNWMFDRVGNALFCNKICEIFMWYVQPLPINLKWKWKFLKPKTQHFDCKQIKIWYALIKSYLHKHDFQKNAKIHIFC